MKIKHISLLVLSAASFCASCNTSHSTEFLDNVNAVLQRNKDDINTCHDAVTIALKAGYDLENEKLNKGCFAFDSVSKQFVIMDGDELINYPSNYQRKNDTYAYFKFTSAYDARSVYSQYLTSDFKGADLLVATTGLDMGNNWNVKQLVYYNMSTLSKNIILNTYSDYLTIMAPTDNIIHYGDANNVFITSMNEDKEFHAYGIYAYIQPSAGNIYLEAGSETDLLELKDESTAKIIEDRNATVTAQINVPEIATDIDINYVEVFGDNGWQLLVNDVPKKNTTTFFRLTSDVAFPKTGEVSKWEVENSFFLDLNGHKISFYGNSDEGSFFTGAGNDKYHAGIEINAKTKAKDLECFIIDTQAQLYERPSIELNDCSIVIQGDETHSARLNITSGRIQDVRGVASDFVNPVSLDYNSASILVEGNTSTSSDREAYQSSFYMYGGYIRNSEGEKFYTKSDGDSAVAFKCIQPRGKGSYVEMSYGDLYSRGYCISGQGNQSFDKFGDTKIKISGGTLVGGLGKYFNDSYTPLFFPQGGEVEITGGNITGPTCLDVKSGTVNINGGTFTATREFNEIHSDNNGSHADGSVIIVEPNGHYAGSDVNLVVNNAIMTSPKGYITNVLHNTDAGGDKGAKVIHNGGTYYYAQGEGTHIDTELSELAKIAINGGTWEKVA